jgi:leader peptidase (prepilin peptidase)/N-methyltransferase
VEVSQPVLLGAALVFALVVGPWLAVVAARLTDSDAVQPGRARMALLTAVFALLLVGAVLFTGLRPATVAYAWAAGAAVVLGAVDLACHRLPDRVTYPAYAVCGGALLVDAVVLGTWPALLTAVLAAAAAFAVAALAAAIAPAGLGFGDVKLLGLLGLLLGWAGWGVLLTGVFLGLVVGALVSVMLLATRRAGWRTAIPFGPPLLAGAVGALLLVGPLPLG